MVEHLDTSITCDIYICLLTVRLCTPSMLHILLFVRICLSVYAWARYSHQDKIMNILRINRHPSREPTDQLMPRLFRSEIAVSFPRATGKEEIHITLQEEVSYENIIQKKKKKLVWNME